MAYRNGTYVAFHAEGTSVPTDSDIKYYNLLKAWTHRKDDDFSMINSHEKTSAVRDSSIRQTLRSRLVTRLRNSKHLLLIIGQTTKNDSDWVPFEIGYAVDECGIPIIATYVDYSHVLHPSALEPLWPAALKKRITDKTARVIHIPFRKEPLRAAIIRFDCETQPKSGLSIYPREQYVRWRIISK
jgi:hypothetical protein